MKRFITLSSLLCYLVSCGISEPEPASQNKRIIGSKELTPVEETAHNRNLVQSIGMMERGCTVTHIGNGLAVTAGHCLSHGSFVGIKQNQSCSKTKNSVHWGVTTNSTTTPLKSECVSILTMENSPTRDYAFITVSPIPKHSLKLHLDDNPENPSKITIFSYPNKRPLEQSDWCEYVPYNTVRPNPSGSEQFFYTCDTEGGSSGAPILNEHFEIIGIHNFYSGILNLNGATRLDKRIIPTTALITESYTYRH